ncbi:MAG TPA: efflux RND transporter periplasmic adaptor subunit, partial [Blastocatellia bacterium]|nr:efflux RND transporter periplasmic adaptor subunit [Blastocatellia bacterium]
DATVSATGTIRLKVGAEVRVGSQLSGIVKKLNVTVGSHIKKGDVIAEIDSRGLEARIEQARAQIRMDDLSLDKARRDLARSRELFSSGVVPRKEIEDAEALVQACQAKVDKSRQDLAVVEVDLAYVRITAPISGTVASVSTQEGETVAASFAAPTFVTIIEDNAVELVAMVDETDISNVHAGDPATFTVESYPSREFSGVVKRISPKATVVSGVVNYEVGIAINKDLGLLKPDMTANISVKNPERASLVVPSSVIQRDGEDRFVYVDNAGKPERRTVTVGIQDLGFTQIKKGLGPGDRILKGPQPASAGQKRG